MAVDVIDFSARQIVVNRQNRVLLLRQVMDDDFAKRRKGLAQPPRNLLELFEEVTLFRGFAFHMFAFCKDMNDWSILILL